MKNEENMPSLKENNNSPITELKGTEFCDLADKEFNISLLKKFNKLQED